MLLCTAPVGGGDPRAGRGSRLCAAVGMEGNTQRPHFGKGRFRSVGGGWREHRVRAALRSVTEKRRMWRWGVEGDIVPRVGGECKRGRRKVGEKRTTCRNKAENKERGTEREKKRKKNTEKSERQTEKKKMKKRETARKRKKEKRKINEKGGKERWKEIYREKKK